MRDLTPAQLDQIESVSMDMWPAYIQSTMVCVPGAKEKIAFDRFHVAKYLGAAVDKVRCQENRELMKQGIEDLKGTKYDWLTNLVNMSERQKERFRTLRKSTLRTARAWAIMETAQKLWHYISRTWAYKCWKRWLFWAMRCRLELVKKSCKNHQESLVGHYQCHHSKGQQWSCRKLEQPNQNH